MRPVALNQQVNAIVPSDPAISPWVLYGCQAPDFQDQIQSAASATTIAIVNKSRFSKLELPLAPLPEQRRIVSALDSYFTRLDAAEQALARVQANLKRYRASVLQAAVEGRLVPGEAELAREEGRDYEPAEELLRRILVERRKNWEEAELENMRARGKEPKSDKRKAKYKEPVAPDTSGLPELPEGWCWAGLAQLGEVARGKSKHRPRNDPRLLDGPYPFIQTGEVRRADGYIESFEATYSEFGLAQSRLWPEGTLCITIAANIAETGILRFSACFPDSVVGFLSSGGYVLTRFVELFLRTARAELDRFAPATAQKNINLQTLNALAVPLPPEAEQERIVSGVDELLSVARHSELDVHRSTERLTRLRQSILKWAFEGKLVDQDPNDEPASVLLERIKAERGAAKRPKRQKRANPDTAIEDPP
jgi:type I restriction enzyme S subunit